MASETPKGVSSRLLTMKFMQRAAASASSSASPNTEAPSSKKRKLEHWPAQGKINPNIDQALIKAALDDQEATRQAALEKHSFADTRWTLDNTWDNARAGNKNPPLSIVYVGYGDIDSSNQSGDNEEAPGNGRTSTRTDKKSASQKPDQERELANKESDDNSEDSDEADGKGKSRHTSEDVGSALARRVSRSQSRSRQSRDNLEAKDPRDKRKKEVRLNQLSSISSGGDSTFASRGSSNSKALTCYNCHQVGHKAPDCPKRGSGKSRRKM